MLQPNWIPTNEYYHRILAAPDAATRLQLYLDLLVEPWQGMMRMMAGAHNGQEDPLAGARMWAWLLPDQVELMASLLATLEAADAWQIGGDALARAAARFAPYCGYLPFSCVNIR